MQDSQFEARLTLKPWYQFLFVLFESFCLLIGLSYKIYNPRDLWGNTYSLFDFRELNVLLETKVLKMQYATHKHTEYISGTMVFVCVCAWCIQDFF